MSEKIKNKIDLLSSKLKEADEDICNLENAIYEEKDKNQNLKKIVDIRYYLSQESTASIM